VCCGNAAAAALISAGWLLFCFVARRAWFRSPGVGGCQLGLCFFLDGSGGCSSAVAAVWVCMSGQFSFSVQGCMRACCGGGGLCGVGQCL
jgi:hypothetical protein